MALGSWENKGTGLAGIIAILAGASEVAISDYPSPAILETLKKNVRRNLKGNMLSRAVVRGHTWGETSDSFSANHCERFTRILCADCLWMDGEHENLIRSMLHFLSHDRNSRISIVAGFHTGRAKVAAFFDETLKAGLVTEKIWERDDEGQERAWNPIGDGSTEDVRERERWLVVAILKRQ
ncbi:uncharacterized protein KY384_000928 [Bacidia gigantensis]|uniref:uncharacterized protein n=1 Tax=Bacidia gigantensis TaxID=2732470 RepID=UPI001D04F285|nr:uncharacterized protein KY384_000928 [Bacidia gigantensis]KAG8534085.1 hypothetical protein KY384_000928 [Bacidia gigantensis]